MLRKLLAFFIIWSAVVSAGTNCRAHDYFGIRVIDDVTGRGVPLVELETVNDICYVTDSAGYVAFHEPGLMGQEVFFHVRSHGYEYPKDRFGNAGRKLRVVAGGEATLRIKRVNIAERMYRITGAGIYRDSILLGKPVPTEQPVLNGRVLGSDSVVSTVYRDQIYWFWGDTNRPSYPLGNFHVPGAVSRLPARGGLDPDVGINLAYFVNENGFAKPTCEMPGKGPTWINGLVVLEDQGKERLFATYAKIEPPLKTYERGLAEFDDESQRFRKVCEFDLESPLFPFGHTFRLIHKKDNHVYFGDPFPLVRVPATPAALQDLSQYEAYTCLVTGSRKGRLKMDGGDRPKFGWKRDTIPYTPELQAQLIKDGKLQPVDGLFQLFDDQQKPISIHRGSVFLNEYLDRWIMIGVERFGTSMLGEVWYAESKQLVGPWSNATKIVTHDRYSFYNPKQHPMFDQDGGRVIYFEGTYTAMFSGNDDPTPRYNYNQIMYKLDLSDPRLHN